MPVMRAGAYWFADEGWVIDFFVTPRSNYPELGQPIFDWCVARGVTPVEQFPMSESRVEMAATNLPVDFAMEFKMTWENNQR